ncbi:MAG: hypothetical protein GX410_03315 [Elusimicrobia bacterium]|nr:hypothetical protein [Elusimicrobiota bacterium]
MIARLQPASAKRFAGFAAFFIFVIAGSAALLSAHRYFNGGQSYEFCHYSEIASNLLDGKGFVSASQTGGNLAFLDWRGRSPQGAGFEASRFPLQALLFAAMQAVFGRGDFAGLAAGALAHALWSAAVFVCGVLFFSPWAAFCAALLWALNPALTAGMVPGGFPDILAGLLCTLAGFGFIYGLQNAKGKKWFFGVGLLCGLAYLSRFTVEIFLPLFPIFAFRLAGWKRGLSLCAFMAAGALIALLPWFAYVLHMTGVMSPPLFWTQLAAHSITGPVPWHEYRLFGPQDFASPGAATLLADKWLKNFVSLARDLPGFWFLYLAWPLAFAFMFKTLAEKTVLRPLAAFYLAALLLQALGFSLLRHETLGFMGGRYYLWLGPLVVLCACQFISEIKAAFAFPSGFLGLFAAANLSVYAYCYWKIEPPSVLPVMEWAEVSWAHELPPDSAVVSNIPAQVSWYAEKASISLPPLPENLPEILKKHEAGFLLLSPSAAGEQWNYPAWGGVARLEPQALSLLRESTGFELVRADGGALLFARPGPTSAPARSRPAGPGRARLRS